MGINFKVAMVLEAVNRMDGGIRGAMNSANRLKRSFADVAKETSRLNPVSGWSAKIAAVSRQMDDFGKKAQSIRDKAEKQMMDGMKGIAAGGAIAAPVLGSIKQGANLQTRFTTMGVMGLSEEGKAIIEEQSIRYAKNLAFDIDQVLGIAQALQKAGLNERKIIQSQKYFTDYAQLEYNRYRSDPIQTATHLAHIGESAGVFNVTVDERSKYGLRTEADIEGYIQKKISNMTETLNRVVSVTSADTATYAETLKYAMPAARANKMSDADAMMMAGIYSRFGIEGSMAGTHMKDFIGRLNPYQHYIDEDVAKKNNRLSAMQAAGWLDGAQWITAKNGQKKFLSPGKSVFHSADGSLKSPDEVFVKIYESYKKFEDAGKSLEFNGILHDTFGEQGEDIAKLMNTDPEMFEKMKTDMGKVMSIEKSLAKYQEDVNTQWDIFTGNIKTASTLLGKTALKDVSSSLKGINESLFGSGEQASPVGTRITEHQDLIRWGMKAVLVVAGLTAGLGAFKIVGAILRYAVISPIAMMCGWLSKGYRHARILYDGFKYFRKGGGKFFESIRKGAQFAYPWLRKIGKVGNAVFKGIGQAAKIGGKIGKYFGGGAMKAIGWFARIGKATGLFTAKWLVYAARIAVGWLIAMGPPGWIILGVTALIIAGVAAWKTNFMGFRDKCISVWNAIKDWSGRTWKSISGFVSRAIEKIGGYIDRIKQALGLASQLDQTQHIWDPIRGVELKGPDIPYLNPDKGKQSQTFQQTNNIKLPNTDLAAEFVKKATPKQYLNSNPEFNLAANGSYF